MKYFPSYLVMAALLFVNCSESESTSPPPDNKPDYTRTAGFRASRILQNYPNNQFPSKEYWQYVGDEMAQKFKDTGPGGIWIVSLYQSNGDTRLNFPVQGAPFGHVLATASDQNDDYLAYFDNTGLKVWLQVEPGLANVDTLIHIILNRYKHHPSVAGFGVDVEWYGVPQHSGGKKLDDQTPQHWEQKVKAVNPEYTLFLKHYSKSWMPPNYRGNIIFVDDSQDFTFSAEPFNAMISEFSAWGTKFYPNKVAFQYGYPKDRSWWSQLNDPPGDIGKALIKNIPNCSGLFWVDFTVTEVFPPGQIP